MQRPGVWFGDYIKQRCSRTEFSGLKGAGRNDLPLQLSVDEFGLCDGRPRLNAMMFT